MPTKDPITELLRETRVKHGLSVLELAEILDIPADRLYKWDQGKSAPKFEDRKKVDKWLAGKNFQHKEPEKAQEANPAPILEILMQKLIQVTDTTNRLLERQEKDLLEKVDRIDANLGAVVAQTEKIDYEVESGRLTILRALSRLEKKPQDQLAHEADILKIELIKAKDEHYRKYSKNTQHTGTGQQKK